MDLHPDWRCVLVEHLAALTSLADDGASNSADLVPRLREKGWAAAGMPAGLVPVAVSQLPCGKALLGLWGRAGNHREPHAQGLVPTTLINTRVPA